MVDRSDGFAWDDTPSEEESRARYRLVRAPQERDLKLIVQSVDFIGARVHWIGRTAPCRKSECAYCKDLKEKRWRGWFFAQIAGGEETIIFEFTAPAGKQLDQFFAKYGTLKGLGVIANRPSKRSNGKVNLRTSGFVPNHHEVKTPPFLHEHLKLIWGVSDVQDFASGGMNAQEVSEADLHQVEAGRSRSDKRNRVPTKSFLVNCETTTADGQKEVVAKLLAAMTPDELASVRRMNGHAKGKVK